MIDAKGEKIFEYRKRKSTERNTFSYSEGKYCIENDRVAENLLDKHVIISMEISEFIFKSIWWCQEYLHQLSRYWRSHNKNKLMHFFQVVGTFFSWKNIFLRQNSWLFSYFERNRNIWERKYQHLYSQTDIVLAMMSFNLKMCV